MPKLVLIIGPQAVGKMTRSRIIKDSKFKIIT